MSLSPILDATLVADPGFAALKEHLIETTGLLAPSAMPWPCWHA